MPVNLLKYLMISTGIIGVGASGASIQLATQIENSNNVSIDKSTLLNGITFNLSSLNNHDDVMGLSLKEDIQMAVASNYRNIDLSTVDMNFYYGDSTEYPIHFVTNNFRTILYFTVQLHSRINQFEDSTMTFDYRPSLYSLAKNYNGYKNPNMFVDQPIDSFNTMGDLLKDFNKYLKTDYVQGMFKKQWKKMGLNADRLSNYDKQESLYFSDDFINFVGTKNFDMKNFSTSYFDEIPELQKNSLFKNFDSSMSIGKSSYFTITSNSTFKPTPDKQVNLSTFNPNFKKMRLGDFSQQIISIIQTTISLATGYQVNLTYDQTNFVFKKGYQDDADIYPWNTNIQELLDDKQTEVWIEMSEPENCSPFLDISSGPGFHIELD